MPGLHYMILPRTPYDLSTLRPIPFVPVVGCYQCERVVYLMRVLLFQEASYLTGPW